MKTMQRKYIYKGKQNLSKNRNREASRKGSGMVGEGEERLKKKNQH